MFHGIFLEKFFKIRQTDIQMVKKKEREKCYLAKDKDQWWNNRKLEKAIVMPYSLQAAITTSSATLPPNIDFYINGMSNPYFMLLCIWREKIFTKERRKKKERGEKERQKKRNTWLGYKTNTTL